MKKVFVGRENELEYFRQTMKKLQDSSAEGQPFAKTILVYGVGGMGKTFLLRKFCDILENEFPDFLCIFIDWDTYKTRGSTFTPEELLDIIHNVFINHFPKEMKPYRGAKKDIQKEHERIARLLEQKRQFLDPVAGAAGDVTADITGNKHLGTALTLGLGFLGKGLSALDEKFLRERAGVSDENVRLYKDPCAALARRLLECIAAGAAKKDKRIVLLFDTGEWIVRVEEWFTKSFLKPLVEENHRTAVVFSGRFNTYNQRTVMIDGQTLDIRGMADLLIYPPQRIDMQVFSRPDIEKYLRESGFPQIDDRLVEMVQSFSRGVPFAVELLANALERIGWGNDETLKRFGGPEFAEQLRQARSNEEVIRQVARRFLLYCFEGKEKQPDRDRILSFAVLNDADSQILKSAWQVDKPGDILEELQAKYALFTAPGKLHDVVKDFLVDYLIEDAALRDDVAVPAVQRAIPLYEEKYRRECEAASSWQERLREDAWKEALMQLLNARVWAAPDEAADFFIKRAVELFLSSPALIHSMAGLFDKIPPSDKRLHNKNRGKIKALVTALDSFNWYIDTKKEKAEMEHVVSFCREALEQWRLDPELRPVLYLVQARAEYNRGNYDHALSMLLDRDAGPAADKALTDKWAEALDDVGKKFSLDVNDLFFYSEKAKKAFEKAARLNNRESAYLYHLGVMIDLGGEPQAALPYYQEALALNPENKYAFNAVGNVYSDLGQYERALEMYGKAIAIDPKYAYPYNGSGSVYRQMGQYDRALEMYEKAIAIDPKDAYPYNGMGYLYMTMGQYEQAISLLLKSIELEPDIGRYVNLGIAHYGLAEPAKGKDYFDRALSCPDKPQDTDHQLNRITACLGNERPDEAMVLLEKLSAKQHPSAYLKGFFTDWQMLAGSPQPPQGIQEFIARARSQLRYEQ